MPSMRSTAVTSFYKELLDCRGKIADLRSALLSTKEHYPDPSDRAAFTLIGLPA